MPRPPISKTTLLCMSLSARPGNFGTRFQNHLYEALGLDFLYKAFTTTDLAAAVGGIRALGIRGCAISMPFKEACIPMLDSLDESASAIGAVNTIVNDLDPVAPRLRGYNTDYIAVRSLIARHGLTPDMRLLLRGSGGMGRAVACAFRDAGFRDALLLARNERTGSALADAAGFRWTPTEAGAEADLLVNVTPLGMEGGPESETCAFAPETIARSRAVFDVVAIPSETPLIRAARAAGKTVITGDAVLVLQGVEQFVLYTGQRPDPVLCDQAAAAAFA
ncbi:shikimate 5-dehydrogenase [Acetobacteraceae bacterium KSS8]|uniref:Shikimate 5-dehydrogenase n=1 Tax=Endosaccharibacter trunci TaxID=2812733 RepID=A0ABT1W466_9PROT|nr:shikimate 5-dehydrogenase [Acetobacteraceae bacterium KSS8]